MNLSATERARWTILKLVTTLLTGDELSSPMLPGFTCVIALLFTYTKLHSKV